MKTIACTLVLFFSCFSAMAYALPPIGVVDSNNDGKVTWEEFSQKFKDATREHFDAIDTDKSNFLDEKEFRDFRGRMKNMKSPEKQQASSYPVLQPQ